MTHTTKEAKQKIEMLNDKNLSNYQPNLPSFTSLMNALYLEVQSQVMSSLYLTERAFHFWSLSDFKPLANFFSGKEIVDINTALLDAAKSSMLDDYSKVVENYGGDAQKFPNDYNTQQGKLWNLKQSDIETLKTAVVMVTIVYYSRYQEMTLFLFL